MFIIYKFKGGEVSWHTMRSKRNKIKLQFKEPRLYDNTIYIYFYFVTSGVDSLIKSSKNIEDYLNAMGKDLN